MVEHRSHVKDSVPLRILLVENRPRRVATIEAELARVAHSTVTRRVLTSAELEQELLAGTDIVITGDPGSPLPVERVLALSSTGPRPAPVVVVSDRVDAERAVACMRLGAADHLHVAHLARLGSVLLNASRAWRTTAPAFDFGGARPLLDVMPWLVLELTVEGRVLAANRAAHVLLGEFAATGRCFLESLAEADRSAVRDALRGADRKSQKPVIARPAGSLERSLAFHFVASEGQAEPARVLAFAVDVTAERRAELESAGYARRLRKGERIEALGLLASGIAHDFNNVLTDIYCVTDLAQLEASPALSAKLQQIFRAVGRGASLTRQILTFSRGQVAEPRVVELDPIVTGMMSMLTRIVRQEVRLEHVASASTAMVNADPTQIEQIVLNLVLNARDASPQGAEVRVETDIVEIEAVGERDAVTPVADAVEDPLMSRPGPGSYVVLRVSDEGAGMSESTRRSLFEPFFSTKSEGRGTGLGLFTVSAIVKGHGGSIVVTSEAGKGTTFEVFLPRLVRAAAHDQAPDANAGTSPDASVAAREPQGGMCAEAGAEGEHATKGVTYVSPSWIVVRASTLGV